MWGHQISKLKINEPWTFKLRSIGSMSTVNHLILTYFGNEIDWLFCESVMSLSWYWRYCFYNMSIHGIPSHSKKLYICNFKFWCAWWQSFLIEVSHFGCRIFLFYIVLVMQFWISASCSSSFDILITVSACIIIPTYVFIVNVEISKLAVCFLMTILKCALGVWVKYALNKVQEARVSSLGF